MDDRSIKDEPGYRDDSQEDPSRPTYKSWKKKYRKMRLQFDQRVSESEELHGLEQNAMRTAKRLAIENDRLMEMLMDINDSPQIPPERRIDLNLDDEDSETEGSAKARKSLKDLLEEVPHSTFSVTAEKYPELAQDLQPKDADITPTGFLTADDIDIYLAQLDKQIGLKRKPTVPSAPLVLNNQPAKDFALRNPTSVYNWLRRHAPKTFLQDLEKEKEKEKAKEKAKEKDRADARKGEGAGSKRKSGARGSKRQSANALDSNDGPEWGDDDRRASVQAGGSLRGKRKRTEDDGGYRPKGGSSRPTKKRPRKSNA